MRGALTETSPLKGHPVHSGSPSTHGGPAGEREEGKDRAGTRLVFATNKSEARSAAPPDVLAEVASWWRLNLGTTRAQGGDTGNILSHALARKEESARPFAMGEAERRHEKEGTGKGSALAMPRTEGKHATAAHSTTSGNHLPLVTAPPRARSGHYSAESLKETGGEKKKKATVL